VGIKGKDHALWTLRAAFRRGSIRNESGQGTHARAATVFHCVCFLANRVLQEERLDIVISMKNGWKRIFAFDK
jgi:hypothetical protein